MYQNLSDLVKDAKASGKDWIISQLKVSGLTFLLLLVGLIITDNICENKWDEGIIIDILIPIVALVIAIIDAIPVIGISAVMLPWAALDTIFGEPRQKGLAIFILFVVIMVIKTFAEPFIRGKSLGVSPIEEVIASVIGWVVFPGTIGSGIGLIVAPLIYTVGKKIYVKTNPNTFFANFGYNFLGSKDSGVQKKTGNTTVVDITDEIEDVEEK